jgi:hypothetical protein
VLFRNLQFRLSARVIGATAGIMLMLVVQTPLLAWVAQSGAMDCCKDGHACCRRLHHRSQQTAPGVQGEFSGMPGCCGGSPGTLSIPMQLGAALLGLLQPPMATQLALLLICAGIAALQFRPEFFQRPPPFLL